MRARLVLMCMAIMMTAAMAAAEQAAVGVSLQPAQERIRANDGNHPSHRVREQQANFNLGTINYAIRYLICIDEAHGGGVAPIEGYIGMPRPCSENWYAGGFLVIKLNGKDIGTTPLSSMMVVENGSRAMLDMVWRAEAADVRVRFIGLPGHECLMCEIAIEPKTEITSVDLGLRCYPSYYTSWHNRDGARRIQTPTELVIQDAPVTVPLAENWWGVYYDETFDVAKGEGRGPCSMLIVPDEGGEIRFAPGDYSVNTGIHLPGETTRVRMALWDHKGLANADALAHVRGQADALRTLLDEADFTPTAVREFDPAKVRAQVEQALASEQVRTALADEIEQIQKWLDSHAVEAGQLTGEPGVAAQEDLLRSRDLYNGFKWQLLLQELLSEL